MANTHTNIWKPFEIFLFTDLLKSVLGKDFRDFGAILSNAGGRNEDTP